VSLHGEGRQARSQCERFPHEAHTSFIEAKLSERILAGFNGASASLVTKIFMFASGCAERMRRNRIGVMIFEGTGRV
jgi:hypothetical protein